MEQSQKWLRIPLLGGITVLIASAIALTPMTARATDGMKACEASGGLFGGHCCNCSTRPGGGYNCQDVSSDGRWSCTSEFCSETWCYL
jgi:hypothetical protein